MDAMRDSNVGATGTGSGWIDKPPGDEEIRSLVAKIGEQQRRVAASGNARLDGRMDRGQHQKRLFAAFGTLRIADGIPAALRHGLFANPASYRAACRFSNGQPCPFDDRKADVRGIAVKLFTSDGVETDLLMTNEGGRSHARNAVQFMDFADVLVAQIERGTLGFASELSSELIAGRLGPVEALRTIAIVSKATLRTVDSLATEHYWGSVVKLGDAAIEYSLHPHAQAEPGSKSDTAAADHLGEELRTRLGQGPVKWQLCAQLYADEESTPVNDASVVWDAPLVPVAELEIAAVASAEDETLIDRMEFNPAHGFEPLGITHARKAVYAASAGNRAGRGLLSSEEARRLLETR
jgi:hypothetical protein